MNRVKNVGTTQGTSIIIGAQTEKKDEDGMSPIYPERDLNSKRFWLKASRKDD